ncbi:hypothetical protein M3Y94_00744900 [Aphelenchoides besseyi]|nr:hypothetical protein M3Y94_00744900 [Aphelenchoides besseyi]
MNVTTTKPPTTVVTTASPALTTLAASTSVAAATNVSASNATSTFISQCGKISSVSQAVRANSYYNNGSCFIAVYSLNVPYANVSPTCRNISKQTNSTADCQMLHTVSASSIRNFITSGLVQSTDSFYMGVSRDSCNSTWHWDNAGGSKTDVATNSSDGVLLPGVNKSCGYNNAIYIENDGSGAIGGATNTTPTNVLFVRMSDRLFFYGNSTLSFVCGFDHVNFRVLSNKGCLRLNDVDVFRFVF